MFKEQPTGDGSGSKDEEMPLRTCQKNYQKAKRVTQWVN